MPFKVKPLARITPSAAVLLLALSLAGCGGLSETGESESPPSALAPPTRPLNDGPHEHEVRLGAHTHTTRLEFKTQPVQPLAGQLAIWSLKVMKINGFDTSDYIREFRFNNAELMHVSVVSQDLSYFNSFDPDYKDYGHFLASSTLPWPGSYKLYADYTPHDGVEEVAQQEVVVAAPDGYRGRVVARHAALSPDVPAAGWLTRQVTAEAPDQTLGQPDSGGPKTGPPAGTAYTVRLMPVAWPVRANQDCLLHLRVQDAAGHPVTDLQPYLGAMGHVTIVSADTDVFVIARPFDSPGSHRDPSGIPEMEGAIPANQHGPDVLFQTNFPIAGRYKLWCQFQHAGLILTAPFVLDVAAPAPASSR